MKLAFQIAITQLLAKLSQTIVAMLGVTFGIGMFIGMISLMKGLNGFTDDLAMATTPHIRIYNDVKLERTPLLEEIFPNQMNLVHHQKPKNERKDLKNGFQIVNYIKNDPRVLGVSPQLSTQVFYNYGVVQLNGTISGVDILQEDKMFDLQGKIKAGGLQELIPPNDCILIGKGLAKKLNAKVGDRVTITTPQGYTMKLKVVGIFQMGIGAIDDIKSYANIATVQKIMQKDSRFITEVSVKMKNIKESGVVAKEYSKLFDYKAEDWETANATILVGKVFRDILTFAVSFTLLVVAGFGIYNILNMTIYNKMKDIAILKATGFTSGDVVRIFMVQSILIGLVGSVAGLLMGFGLASWLASIPVDFGDAFSLTRLPVSFDPTYYYIGVIFGITTTALAGYLPSRKAGKIDPIQILRG
ncbi:ABC transporter permease [Thermoflexibacter ruber]|uniref:Lipoprotein-releasing system permease protein n=1 Tax=Thermoflexibacter ruber TaxID=1003 RepID=A0A1I2IXE0_9BACT|nr:FtsX-like permease family protein [Thermoflexibacter ruber]SFF46964.1 lipoprotein-releasing system permease protein [Thermoflexibacter ruber]